MSPNTSISESMVSAVYAVVIPFLASVAPNSDLSNSDNEMNWIFWLAIEAGSVASLGWQFTSTENAILSLAWAMSTVNLSLATLPTWSSPFLSTSYVMLLYIPEVTPPVIAFHVVKIEPISLSRLMLWILSAFLVSLIRRDTLPSSVHIPEVFVNTGIL